jgi:hypothetical protein
VVQELVDSKVDKSSIDQLIERINKIQEMAESKITNTKAGVESEDDEAEEEEGNGDPGSPDSIKKKKKKANEPDSEDERVAEEAKKQAEEA